MAETIAFIGAGKIAKALAGPLVRAGHSVAFGVRDTAQTAPVPGTTLRSVREAAAAANVVVLAVPWAAVPDALREAGDLTGKVLIDTTNAVGPDFSSAVPDGQSTVAITASLAPGARVVKAFNQLGAQAMGDDGRLTFEGKQASTLICGEDKAAKETVAALARDIGFDVVDCGGISSGKHLDYLALLWIKLAYGEGHGAEIAFRLLRR